MFEKRNKVNIKYDNINTDLKTLNRSFSCYLEVTGKQEITYRS